MSPLISINDTGFLNTDLIVMAAPVQSKPILRLLQATDSARVINLTYGYRHQTLALLKNGYLVVLPMTIAELSTQMRKAAPDDGE